MNIINLKIFKILLHFYFKLKLHLIINNPSKNKFLEPMEKVSKIKK